MRNGRTLPLNDNGFPKPEAMEMAKLDIVLWAPSTQGGSYKCELSMYQGDHDHVAISVDCGYDNYATVFLDRDQVRKVMQSLQAWLGEEMER